MTTIFISGSRNISCLNDMIRERLHNVISQGFQVVVGDANGADKAIQKYLFDMRYKSVKVFCSGNKFRNNLGNWPVEYIPVSSNLKGRDFYTVKDKAMALQADYGFVLWDGKSSGSFNNIMELLRSEKKALVYFSPMKKFFTVSNLSQAERLLDKCDNASVQEIRRKTKFASTVKEITKLAQISLIL